VPDGEHVTLAWGRAVIVGETGHALKVAVTVTAL
jgi:hypothetical protein